MCSKRQTRFGIVRKLGMIAVLLMVMGTVGVGWAAAKKKPKPPVPQDLPGKVDYYSWQLRGLHLDESGPLGDQIQKLVLDHLQTWMAERTPTGVEVRRELESIFAKVRYPINVKPATFAMPWKGGLIIAAGYSLGWTEQFRVNTMAIFENRDGKSRLAATTNFIPRADVRYQFLPDFPSDDFQFFVYGFKLGKSHPVLAAVLYSYDGQTLKPRWQIDQVYDGKMSVEVDHLTIRFLKEEEYAQELVRDRLPPRHEAVYKLTPQGVELQNQREIPY